MRLLRARVAELAAEIPLFDHAVVLLFGLRPERGAEILNPEPGDECVGS